MVAETGVLEFDAEGCRLAKENAMKSLAEGGIPIGAALITDEGKLLATGYNQRIQKNSAVLHGEMDALERAGRLPASTLRRCILYTSLSPCPMCTGAILLYKIPRVVVLDNKGFMGDEDRLRQAGVVVVQASDDEMIQTFATWKTVNPGLWNEDIGE